MFYNKWSKIRTTITVTRGHVNRRHSVEKHVFQFELEEVNTMIEEKEEAQCSSKIMDMNLILAAKSQMATQISTQFKEQEARILQVTLQIAEMSSQMLAQ